MKLHLGARNYARLLAGEMVTVKRRVRVPKYVLDLRGDMSEAWTDDSGPYGDYLHVPCPEVRKKGTLGELVYDSTVQRLYAPWMVGDLVTVERMYVPDETTARITSIKAVQGHGVWRWQIGVKKEAQ